MDEDNYGGCGGDVLSLETISRRKVAGKFITVCFGHENNVIERVLITDEEVLIFTTKIEPQP